MYGDLVVLNSLLTFWRSLRRCNPDLPHPQVHVLIRTQYLTLPNLFHLFYFPFLSLPIIHPRQEPGDHPSVLSLITSHFQSSIKIGPFSCTAVSNLTHQYLHHRCHNSGPLSLVCTVVTDSHEQTAFSFFGCTLPPSSSSTSELLFWNANHSTVKALQDKNTTSYGLLLYVPFHWPLQR